MSLSCDIDTVQFLCLQSTETGARGASGARAVSRVGPGSCAETGTATTLTRRVTATTVSGIRSITMFAISSRAQVSLKTLACMIILKPYN